MQFSHGISLKLDFLCIVYEAIKDRITDSCLFDFIVPAVDGRLSYEHCGRQTVSVEEGTQLTS